MTAVAGGMEHYASISQMMGSLVMIWGWRLEEWGPGDGRLDRPRVVAHEGEFALLLLRQVAAGSSACSVVLV